MPVDTDPAALAAKVDLSREACDERLRTTLLEITEHPERWAQWTWGATYQCHTEFNRAVDTGQWPCRTRACLAGTAAIRAGMAWTDEDGMFKVNPVGDSLLARDDVHVSVQYRAPFEKLAAVLFGLSDEQTSAMTNGTNTLFELWAAAAEFTDWRVALPQHLQVQVAEIDDDSALARGSEGAGGE